MLVDDLLGLLDGGEGVEDLVQARVPLLVVEELGELLHRQVRLLLRSPANTTGQVAVNIIMCHLGESCLPLLVVWELW